MFWNRFPFARILLPFLSGTIIAVYFRFSHPIPVYIFIILFFVYSLLVIVFQQKFPYRFRWISGIVILVFFFLSGYQLKVLKDTVNHPNYFGQYASNQGIFVGTLTEPVRSGENSYKAIVEITSFKDSIAWHETSGEAIIYFAKDSLSKELDYGDNILVSGIFNPIKPPLNPGEYNYKAYLQYRSVEYSTYLRQGKWRLISKNDANPILKFAYSLRRKLLTILSNCNMACREFGVISALLIGYTDKLDPELIKDYQGSGAMHILSVSGMHVGVIYLFLNFFLFFLEKFRYGRIPKAVILIVFVWFYAVLTGLSPPVLRAATMFSFIAIGNALKYPANIFNTLAASAFVLLAVNPYFLMDVGFQLSYLAVAGIVVIYPYIYKSWSSRYWLIYKIWSLISVSIAAQIITFPLCLYYFHQFPNYFILTNMIAVPLSAVVIYLGIAYLIFYSVPYLSLFLANALTYSLSVLNGAVSFIEGLPFSVSRAISVTATEMIIIYLILIFVVIFLILKKPKMLITAMVFLLILLSSFFTQSFIKAHQKKIIVYNISRSTAIDFVNGNTAYFVTDSALRMDIKKQDFHITNCRIQNSFRVTGTFDITNDSLYLRDNIFYQNHGLIYFAGKSMAIVEKSTNFSKQIVVDYLLISHNPKINIDALLKQYKPGLVILDASNYPKNIKKWINQCQMHKIPVYVTTATGAWVCEL
jgi:competence protein ComEC